MVCHWHEVLPQGTCPAVVCAQTSHLGLTLTCGLLCLTRGFHLQKCKMYYESLVGDLPRKSFGHLKAVQGMLASHLAGGFPRYSSLRGSFGAWASFRSILSDIFISRERPCHLFNLQSKWWHGFQHTIISELRCFVFFSVKFAVEV